MTLTGVFNIPFDHWAAWIRMIDWGNVLVVIRYLVFLVTAMMFVYGSAMNWFIFYEGIVRRRKTASYVPVFIGVIGSVSFAISPFAQLRRLWWLPLIIDWGTLPGMSYTAYYYLTRRKK